MLCIVLCHYLQYYGNEWAWWLNVGVQVFLIISGFLYGNKPIDNPVKWIGKQFSKILIPYWTYLIIAFLAYYIVAPEYLSVKSVVGSLLTLSTIKGMGHFWFISTILFCYFITPYLAAFRDFLSERNFTKALFFTLVILGVYTAFALATRNRFNPGIVSCYIVGYYMSYFVQKYGNKVLDIAFYLSIPLALFSKLLFSYFAYVQGCDMTIGMYVLVRDYSHLLLALMCTLFFLKFMKSIKYYTVLKYSDKFSYEVYITHHFFLLGPLSLLVLTDNMYFNWLIAVVAILISGVVLNKLSGRLKGLLIRG